MTEGTFNWGPGKVRQQRGTRLSADRWCVQREGRRFAERLTNDRGRTKKFKSEAAAVEACGKAKIQALA